MLWVVGEHASAQSYIGLLELESMLLQSMIAMNMIKYKDFCTYHRLRRAWVVCDFTGYPFG